MNINSLFSLELYYFTDHPFLGFYLLSMKWNDSWRSRVGKIDWSKQWNPSWQWQMGKYWGCGEAIPKIDLPSAFQTSNSTINYYVITEEYIIWTIKDCTASSDLAWWIHMGNHQSVIDDRWFAAQWSTSLMNNRTSRLMAGNNAS